jgi:hypothetical protein
MNLTIVSLILPDNYSLDHVFHRYYDAYVVPLMFDVQYKHPEHLYFESKNNLICVSFLRKRNLLLYLSVRVTFLE